MSPRPGEPRRVTLTSGTELRVLSFAPAVRPCEGLHVCPACAAPRVLPVHWERVGRADWAVLRRCPDCAWQGAARHPQGELDRYDEELDRGTAALVRGLRALVAERMAEDVERFLDALGRDQVLPEDF